MDEFLPYARSIDFWANDLLLLRLMACQYTAYFSFFTMIFAGSVQVVHVLSHENQLLFRLLFNQLRRAAQQTVVQSFVKITSKTYVTMSMLCLLPCRNSRSDRPESCEKQTIFYHPVADASKSIKKRRGPMMKRLGHEERRLLHRYYRINYASS